MSNGKMATSIDRMGRTHWTADPVERFWSKVDKAGECWLWTDTPNDKGYGRFYVVESGHKKSWLAHRYVYELLVGPIPEGLFVCHHCDNPPCVNPDDLFLGTQADNMADMVGKGRSPDHVGEQNTNAKLSPDQVTEIRRLYATGVFQRVLAAQFSVPQPHISQIVLRKAWSHVP